MEKQILIIDENFDRDSQVTSNQAAVLVPIQIFYIDLSPLARYLYVTLKAIGNFSDVDLEDQAIQLTDFLVEHGYSETQFNDSLNELCLKKVGRERCLARKKESSDSLISITLTYIHDVFGGDNE